jgi:hypothetical protein
VEPRSDCAQFLKHPCEDVKASKLGVEAGVPRSPRLRKHPSLKRECDNPRCDPSWRSRMTRRRASSAVVTMRTREASSSDRACTFAIALATSAAIRCGICARVRGIGRCPAVAPSRRFHLTL